MSNLARKQSSTTHPIPFGLVSSLDHSTPIYGAAPVVSIAPDATGPYAAALGAVTELSISKPTGLATSAGASTGGFLAQSTTYYYKVTALGAAGETDPTAVVSYAVGATGTATNKVTLTWSASTGEVNGYNIYRGTTSGQEQLLGTVAHSVLTYVDSTNTTPAGALPSLNTTSGGGYSWAGNATDRATTGAMWVHITATNADPVDMAVEIVPWDPYDGVRLGLTSLPNAAAAASGGLPTFGSSSGQINPSGGKVPATVAAADVSGNVPSDVQTIKTQTVTAAAGVTFPASVGTSTYAGGAVASVTGAVGSVTGAVTVGTNNDKTGYALAAAGLDAIPVTDPGAPANWTTFPKMFVALCRRFQKKTKIDTSANTLVQYADDGTTVNATQSLASTATTQTQGAAS